MKRKIVSGIMLTLLLTFAFSTVLVMPVAGSYPIEDIFRKGLFDIANSVPQIEGIYIKRWLDSRPTGHLWASIRINYTAGLSDYEKIEIQNYVQHLLESKPYIDIVEPNYIVTIPEQPIPWPGFVIGDLNVAFKSTAVELVAVGDVNGDGIVNIVDGVIIGVAFGSRPGDPNWNPIADIAPDNFINIQDVVLWAIHFGETY